MGFIAPAGWIIAALLPEDGPRCPECLGVVVPRARRCRHCGSPLEAHRLEPPEAHDQWYVRSDDGIQEGPFSPQQLLALVKSGRLSRHASCARAGTENWQRISDCLK